jgi:hypothetical protein
LEDRRDRIGGRWYADVRSRLEPEHEDVEGTLPLILNSLVAFLLETVGNGHDAAEEIWQQAAHLYGAFAVRRGLAAGEVVEELQLLRTVILRFLLEEQDIQWEDRSFRWNLLSLNRLLDLGVASASIAYVDDLFFAHVQGSGVTEGVTDEVAEEIRRQLESFKKELGI